MTGKTKKNSAKETEKSKINSKSARYRISTLVDIKVVESLKKRAEAQGIDLQTLMNEILRDAIETNYSYEARLRALEDAVFKK